MSAKTVAIALPEELIDEIDKEVGAENRSTFLAQALRERLRRHRGLIQWLRKDEAVWKDEDHPDLVAMGTNEWVRQLREESESRPALNPPYARPDSEDEE